MRLISTIIMMNGVMLGLTGCSGLYVPQTFEVDASKSSVEQAKYNLEVIALSESVVQTANEREWIRNVVVSDSTSSSLTSLRSEVQALSEKLPPQIGKPVYRVGIGDTLTFIENTPVIDGNGVSGLTSNSQSLVVPSSGKIVLPRFGSIDVAGKTLGTIRSELGMEVERTGDRLGSRLLRAEPPSGERPIYRLGAGDILSLTQTVASLSSTGEVVNTNSTRNIVISSMGSVNLLGAGEVNLEGLSISDAKIAIYTALLQDGLNPEIELALVENRSSPIQVLGDTPNSRSIPIGEAPLNLGELIVVAGVRPSNERDFVIRIIRDGVEFEVLASSVLGTNRYRDTFLRQGDIVLFEAITSRPAFDIFVNNFGAHQVTVLSATSSVASRTITLTEEPLTLVNVLAGSGLVLNRYSDVVVRLIRSNIEYRVSGRKVLLDMPDRPIYLMPDDTVVVEPVEYDKQTVMITGAGTSAKLIEISPETRPTLASAIFTSGALSNDDADLKQVFLLRKKLEISDEFETYHLDLSDASRLVLAREFELRPDDIIFVSTQPVSQLTQVLARINSALSNGLGLAAVLGGN